jgi:hypothetical protein
MPRWYSYALGSTVGLNRLLLMAKFLNPQMSVDDVSNEDVANRQKYLMCNPRHMFSLLDEFSNLNETLAQMK